jgi:CBS domain-containing protein
VLAATIFFDLRPVAGATERALPLRRFVQERAAAAPRFIRQLAAHALAQRPPLAWHGGVAGELDLKLQGTAIFVEAARVLALATGVAATGTAARLEQAGAALGVPATERETWVAAFQHLQRLRLAAQAAGHGNHCDVAALNMLDRRMLRETLHVAQGLQQRVALDWAR